nr:hypothetical protein [Tanacetum cinerariifolium]
MSTQQDIYTAGSESRPHMLNKENYVPWSSRLLRYAKSRPNGKLIYNSIINGPYVRRMIPEPGDANREVTVTETFHVQTDDKLTDKKLKQIEADDQAIQTILLGSDIGIQEKNVKLFNEWEMFTSNERESIESYYHRFLKLMNDLKRNKHFPEKIASNLKFLNNLQPEWSRHVTIVHQTKDLHTADYTQLYDFLKYNQKEHLIKINQNYMQQPMPNPEDITDPTTAMNMELALMTKAFKLNYSSPTNNNQRILLNPHNRQIAQPGMNMGQDRQMQMVGGNANQNLNGNGNLIAVRAEGNAAGHNGNQIRYYNCRGKEEAGIQLQVEEYDLMAAAADLDEIKEVNANCILMDNMQQASTSDTQTDKAPVYDSDGSAEYTELLEPIPESHQVPQNDNNVISEVTSVEQGGEIVEQHLANFEETQKSTVSSHLKEKKKLKSDFKTRKGKLLDKQIQLEKRIKELNNILVKTSQSIQTIHMLSPKPDSFYHTEQKMALGYQNSFYLKQAQKKQQSLYDEKVLLEKHDPPVVHDSEETLQLAQESSEKIKQLNKEIKPANYTKINHILGIFVPQTAKSHEELYFLNISKTANVSKSISIPNDDFSDDTTPSVARKFLNKEAAKFVGDFKSLANEADESLAKHKALELEIERLLKAVVSQDIMNIVQKESVVDTSDLKTKLERTKNALKTVSLKRKINMLNFGMIGMFRINPFKTSREEKHVPTTVRASNRTKPITISQPPVFTKKDVNSDSNGLSSTGVDNTKTRRPQPRSNTKNDRVPFASKSSQSKNKGVEVKEHHRNLLLSKNNKHMSSACNNTKLDSQNVISKVVCAMCKQCLISVNHDVYLRNYVNGKNSRAKKHEANVSIKENQKKHQPQVKKPKKVGLIERLATPKPR